MSYKYPNCNFNKFFRELEIKKYSDKFSYANNISNLSVYNVHNGQVKLFYSELEFFNIVSKYISFKDCIVIYVGAAPGVHTPILLDMFEDIQMVLYDLRQFDSRLEQHSRVIIKNEYFTDESVEELKDIIGNKKVIYVCDMRREKDEKEIMDDLINQQKWGIMLNSEFMLLKMRMPYDLDDVTYTLSDNIKKSCTIRSVGKGEFMYLDGTILLQLYPGQQSTETRLLVCKKKYTEKTGEGYYMRGYNIDDYERSLMYYNTYLRPRKYEYKMSDDAKNHLLGFDDGYDSVGEYFLAAKYLKYYKKTEYNHRDVIKLMYDIFISFTRRFHKNHITIHVKYIMDTVNKIKQIMRENKNLNFSRYFGELYVFLNELPIMYRRNHDKVINSTILTKTQIDEQIEEYNMCSKKYIKFNGGELTVNFHV